MPRYGEASVVGKAWSDDHPIASAAVPAAAVGIGGMKLKAGLRPNPTGMVANAEKRVGDAASKVEEKLRAQQAARLKGKAPTGGNPLRFVSQKRGAWKARRTATSQLRSAENTMRNAENVLAHTRRTIPKATRPGVRLRRVGVGGALTAAGGYGLYRRFGAPKRQPMAPPGGGYAPMG